MLLSAVPLLAWSAPSTNETVQLYLPDGQLKSHLIRVYVNQDITELMKPELMLHADHALTRTSAWENTPIPYYGLSRNYRWTQKLDNQPAEKRGTLLLFDLHKIKIPAYKAIIRITPTLVWSDGNQTNRVIGETEVYLANTTAVVAWSGAVIGLIAIFIGFMSWQTTRESGRPTLARVFASLANPDGSLSMWRAQLAAWTVAIGCVVFGYGLIRLEVPEIPDTLVALMGLSLVTGGLSAMRQPTAPDTTSAALAPVVPTPVVPTPVVPTPVVPTPVVPTPTAPAPVVTAPVVAAPVVAAPVVAAPAVPAPLLPMRLSDLITNYDKDTQRREVSVAKSQMVFWTILTLGIFLTKSMTDGTLWPVPWQMVALMGMSQAGYVAPKFVPPTKG